MICQRIAQVRLEFAGPRGKSRFSKELGISPSTYDYYESSRVPPAEVLVKITNLAGVDLRWLLTGEGVEGADGTSIATVQNHPILQRAAKLLSQYPHSARPLGAFLDILTATMGFPQKDGGQGSQQGVEKKLPGAQDAPKSAPDPDPARTTAARRTWIPILGRSAAGVSHFWCETENGQTKGLTTLMDLIERHAGGDEFGGVFQNSATVMEGGSGVAAGRNPARKETVQIITLREPITWGKPEDGGVAEFVASERLKMEYPDAFAVRIDGESMSPEIRHGNLVVLSTSQVAVPGRAAVVQLAGAIGVTCKLYHPAGGNVHLVPINEQFTPSVVEADDVQWALRVLARIQP